MAGCHFRSHAIKTIDPKMKITVRSANTVTKKTTYVLEDTLRTTVCCERFKSHFGLRVTMM